MSSGIIFINKQPGITSFDALRCVKRFLGTGKVGHTGTLDKFASGLLIVLAGRSLKLCKYFSNCDKRYKGRIRFGIETDTLDPEGTIIAESDVPLKENILNVLPRFTGVIMQTPPEYSAIHINGKRASALARAGNAPEMKKRQVTVYQLELTCWQPPFADIFVHCSSGTYIRSLARDIALAAGSRGYLQSLLRTQAAGFSLDECEAKDIIVHPVDKNIISKLGLPWFTVSKDEAKDIFHGKALDKIVINKNFLSGESIQLKQRITADSENAKDLFQAAAVFEGEELIAVLEKTDGKWKYGCVM